MFEPTTGPSDRPAQRLGRRLVQRLAQRLARATGLLSALALLACGSSYLGAEQQPDLSQPLWMQELPTEAGPSALALADFDADGRDDVAVVSGVAGSVSLFLRSGSRLSPGRTYMVGRGAAAIVSLLLDDDSRPDLVVANAADNTLSTLLSKGQPPGELAPGPLHSGIENPTTLAVSDVDSDGIQDLLVASAGTDTITVLGNKKQGGMFSVIGTPFAAGPYVRGVAVLPLDASQNKRLDLAIARAGSDEIGLYENDGLGRFTPSNSRLRLPTDSTPVALAAGNLDGDPAGRMDLAVLGHSGGRLALGYSVAADEFSVSDYHIAEKPSALALGKLDADNRPDLAITDPSAERVAVLFGRDLPTRTGSLPVAYYSTLGLPTAVAIADIDDDSWGDLLVLCRQAAVLRIIGLRGSRQ